MAISHEHAHPDIPEYNSLAGRGLRFLREKPTAFLEDRAEGNSNNLWAEMMGMVCDMGSICDTTAQEGACRQSKSGMTFFLTRAEFSLSIRLCTCAPLSGSTSWSHVAFGASWWG